MRGLSTSDLPDLPRRQSDTDGAALGVPVPLPAAPSDEARDSDVASALAVLTDSSDVDRATRARQLLDLARAMGRSGRAAGGRAMLGGRWLVDLFLEIAPRIPVRDLATLRAHHDGLDGDLLAEALVSAASKATAAVGAGAGALAAVEWVAAPTLLVSAPVQLTAETLAVAAIEVKLIAELHQVYGAAPGGTTAQRAMAYVMSWTRRRGIDPSDPGGIAQLVAGPARRAIRKRLTGRLARSLGTLGPLLSGAAIGSVSNHRETTSVGRAVMEDLRSRR